MLFQNWQEKYGLLPETASGETSPKGKIQSRHGIRKRRKLYILLQFNDILSYCQRSFCMISLRKKSRTVWNLKTSEGDNLQRQPDKQKIHILLPAWKGYRPFWLSQHLLISSNSALCIKEIKMKRIQRVKSWALDKVTSIPYGPDVSVGSSSPSTW